MLRQPNTTKNPIPNSQNTTNQLLTLPSFSETTETELTGGPGGPHRPWWRQPRGITGLSLLLLILLLGGIFLTVRSRRQVTTYQFQKVSMSDLSLTVSATGPLQSATYNLMFVGTGGKIDEIDVKVGQTVSQGQVLAVLDKTALQDAVDQQQAAVLAAQGNLDSAQASLSKAQAQANASVTAAQTALNNAQANQSRTQAQSQASINAALTALNNDQINLTNTQNSSQASVAAAQTSLDNAQKNLASTQTLAQAQKDAAASQEAVAIGKCGTDANCIQAAQDAFAQAVAAADASIAQAQAQLNTAQSQLNTAQASATANNAAAQARVDADQKALASSQAAANTNNTAAQGQVNTAQSQLASAQASAGGTTATTQGQVSSAQGQFNVASQQLATAKHNLENATLKAPHDGVVAVINGTVGGAPGVPATGSAAGGGSTFIQIVDIATLQVQANVNESDTGNLKVGEPVSFSVNAYSDRQFSGTVSAISPNGQTASNVVTYPVSIDVDMTSLKGANLLPGMTANVTVTVVQRQNVMTIPVNAVNFARLASSGSNTVGTPQLTTKQAALSAVNQARQRLNDLQNQNPDILAESPVPAFVLEQNNGNFIIVPVVLGLTDGTVYEVLDGLSVSDTFVVGAQQGR